MMIWNGLWKKEWLLMRGWFYGTAIAAVTTSLFIPLLLIYFLGLKIEGVDSSFYFLALLWMSVSVFVPLSLIITSINVEISRPDVWLHTPASIYQLFGVKIIFALFIGVINFALSIVSFMILLKISNALTEMMGRGELFLFLIKFLSVLLLFAFIVLIIGLFFRVLYLVLKPYLKSLTAISTIILFFIFMSVTTWISSTELYMKIASFGRIKGYSGQDFRFGDGFSYIEIDEAYFRIGEISLTLAFGILLFFVSTMLFEKKVRL